MSLAHNHTLDAGHRALLELAGHRRHAGPQRPRGHAGGEFVGASTHVYEHAPKHRRAFMVGLLQLGTGLCYPASAFFAFGLATWIGDEAFVSWEWRTTSRAIRPGSPAVRCTCS